MNSRPIHISIQSTTSGILNVDFVVEPYLEWMKRDGFWPQSAISQQRERMHCLCVLTHTNLHPWLNALKINAHSVFDLWITQKNVHISLSYLIKGNYLTWITYQGNILIFHDISEFCLLGIIERLTWSCPFVLLLSENRIIAISALVMQVFLRSKYCKTRQENFNRFWKFI